MVASGWDIDQISHALVLNLPQPAGNLHDLFAQRDWDVREIIYAMDLIPRFLWGYEDVGRVHVSLSGTLLETLSSPEFQQRVYGIMDCGALLWHFQNMRIIHILGTAFYHPVLPLIPPPDREEQVHRWLGSGHHLFGRPSFSGFWPPEMGFSMDLIPMLRRAGYRYVLVDSAYVEPVTPMRWEELRYRPHLAQYDGQEIVVVLRDRELSNAQESGLEYAWFEREVRARTKWCRVPPLVTTCTDGENGGWFRNVNHRANFWGAFYGELCDRARAPGAASRPTFIDDYLNMHGAQGYVTVRTGAWNTGWHHERDFMQWTGSQAQQDTLRRTWALSGVIQEVRRRANDAHHHLPAFRHELESALWHVRRAETSCYVYWGEAWVTRAHADLDRADWPRGRARACVP